MATQIKLRRDTADNWDTNNPTLASGEPGFVTDTGLLKIGDGTTAWDDLAGIETGGGGGGMEIGTIYAHGGTVAPIGSFVCDGTAISRTEYADLFAAIGTTWGVGDGTTTFNLPDLNGAFLRGTGSHGTETMANGSAFAGPAVGAFEDDQMQGHWHEQYVDENVYTTGANKSGPDTGGNDILATGAQSIRDAITDGTNGTPRTGDETRPFAAGVTYCIKATPATNSGTPLPTYSYSTGWVANSDWTNAEFTVNHGLNTPLSDLVVEFLVSTDGTDEKAIKIDCATTQADEKGVSIYGRSSSQIAVHTGLNGILITEDGATVNASGAGKDFTIDTEAYYYKVKVYRPEVLATELAVTKYDTGWVDFAGNVQSRDITITHNLGQLSEDGLIIQMWLESDDALFSGNVGSAELARTTASDWGFNILSNDANSFRFLTAPDGIIHYNTSGVISTLNNGDTTARYRFIVYAPNLLENVTPAAVKSISADYTITGRTDSPTIQATTGATDRTVTLPAGSSMIPGDEFEISKIDAGAGKVTVARAGSDTIDGVTGVDIDSRYDLARVRWTGSYWTLVEYKDHGSNANGEWTRYVDGTMVESVNTTATNPATSFSWPVTFDATPRATATCRASSDRVTYFNALSSSNYTIVTLRPDNAAKTTDVVDIIATGRWRA